MRFASSLAPRALFSVTLFVAASFAATHGGASTASADPPTIAHGGTPLPIGAHPPGMLEQTAGSHHLVLIDPIIDETANGAVLTGQLRNECPNGYFHGGTGRAPLGVYENGELIGTIPVADLVAGQTKPFTIQLIRKPALQTLNIGSQGGGAGAGKLPLSSFAVRRRPYAYVQGMAHPLPTPTATPIKMSPHTEILILPPCG